MKLTNKDKNFWKKNGYLVVKNVLNEKQCQEYKKEAHRVAGKNITIIPNIYRKSKKFLNLCKNKKILQLADNLIDHRMIPIGDIFFFAKSDTNKESGSVPHQIIMHKKLNMVHLLHAQLPLMMRWRRMER